MAVIGSSSSGIQIVPAILPGVMSMDHYVRGSNWLGGAFGRDEFRKRIEAEGGNFAYTEAEKMLWANDRDAYVEYRRAIEYGIMNKFGVLIRGSKEQTEVRKQTEASMLRRLKGNSKIMDHLRPEFSPCCKRLSPGPGYLEALTSSKVRTITTGISHIDQHGTTTTDGVNHPVDVIICATSFQTAPGSRRFPNLW